MSVQGIEKNALGASFPGHTNLEEARLFDDVFELVTFGGRELVGPSSIIELCSIDLGAKNQKDNIN